MSEFKKGDELWYFDEFIGEFIKVRLLSLDCNRWCCEITVYDDWKDSDEEIKVKAHMDLAVKHIQRALLHRDIDSCLVARLKTIYHRHHLEIGALYNARDQAVEVDKGTGDI